MIDRLHRPWYKQPSPMRTRDRPWTTAVARRVLQRGVGDEVKYYREQVLPQTQQLVSRAARFYQSPRRYIDTSFQNKTHNDERNVYLKDYQRNNSCIVSFPKTADGTTRYPSLLNGHYLCEESSLKRSLLRKDLVSRSLSSSICDRPTRQNSAFSSPSTFVMTRTILPHRSKSASKHRLKVGTINRDSSRSIEDIVNTDRSTNCRALYPNFNIAGSITENNQDTSVDDITKSGMKNRYRNINETLFDLSPDSETRDVSGGVTFAVVNNGRKSSVCAPMASISATRRTSSPDLPPITNEFSRGDKWKIASSSTSSTTGTKFSATRISTAVSRTTSYSRRNSTATAQSCTDGAAIFLDDLHSKDRLPICRNHSDSSLYNLNANGSYPSKESDSTSISCATLRAKEASGSSSSSQGRDDARSGGVRDAKYVATGNRKPTLAASDVQGRLETLFEGQNGRKSITYNINNNANYNNSNDKVVGQDSYNQNSVSSKTIQIRTVNNNIHHNGNRLENNLSIKNNVPSTSPLPRSAFVKDVANNEGISRHRTPNRKFRLQRSSADTNTAAVLTNKGRMVRSQSENKVTEKSHCNKNQEKTTPRFISRNLSVDRTDKLRPHSQKCSTGITSRYNQGGNFQAKYNSVSNLNNRHSRDELKDTSIKNDLYYSEDSTEAKDRLVEWLNVVNNIDRYDTDPKDDIIDYSDEPPQTDTAIHLVYEGE